MAASNQSARHSATARSPALDEQSSLKAQVPPRWPDARRRQTTTAIDKFEIAHRKHLVQGARAHRESFDDVDDYQPEMTTYRYHVTKLLRNRLAIPDQGPDPVVRIHTSRKAKIVAKPTWIWPGKIWLPRKKWAASRDYFDNEAVVAKAISLDWNKAIDRHGLRAHLLRHDPSPKAGADAAAVADERLSEMEEVMISNGPTFYMTFYYYCTKGAGDDLAHIGKGGYQRFLDELDLDVKGSKACSKAQLDLIFYQANAKSKKPGHDKDEDSSRNKSALSRHEFMQCFVRIAIARFLQGKHAKATSVAQALDELFTLIRTKADNDVLQDSTRFRQENCYTEEVDMALQAHEPALRSFFRKYAVGDGPNLASKVESIKLMNADEWVTMVRGLGLLGDDVSMENAQSFFLWSRMLVIDEDNPAERVKMFNLSFEDFLECMVRLAHEMALPTDEEISERGSQDAGYFFADLKAKDVTDYHEFVAEKKGGWDKPLRQPIDRALHHMMSVIMMEMGMKVKRIDAPAPKPTAPPKPKVGDKAQASTMGSKEAPAPLSDADLQRLGDAIDACDDIERRAAVRVQATIRGKLARKRKRRRLHNLVWIQAFARGIMTRKVIKAQHKSCCSIQMVVRGFLARKAFLHGLDRSRAARDARLAKKQQQRRSSLMSRRSNKPRPPSPPKSSRPIDGAKWKSLGFVRPTVGNEIINEDLSEALHDKVTFSKEEFERFQVKDLRTDSFVMVARATGDEYFEPDSRGTNRAKALSRKIEALIVGGDEAD